MHSGGLCLFCILCFKQNVAMDFFFLNQICQNWIVQECQYNYYWLKATVHGKNWKTTTINPNQSNKFKEWSWLFLWGLVLLCHLVSSSYGAGLYFMCPNKYAEYIKSLWSWFCVISLMHSKAFTFTLDFLINRCPDATHCSLCSNNCCYRSRLTVHLLLTPQIFMGIINLTSLYENVFKSHTNININKHTHTYAFENQPLLQQKCCPKSCMSLWAPAQ